VEQEKKASTAWEGTILIEGELRRVRGKRKRPPLTRFNGFKTPRGWSQKVKKAMRPLLRRRSNWEKIESGNEDALKTVTSTPGGGVTGWEGKG